MHLGTKIFSLLIRPWTEIYICNKSLSLVVSILVIASLTTTPPLTIHPGTVYQPFKCR